LYNVNRTKISFLIAPPLQGPLIYKWKMEWSRSITQITKTQNDKVVYVCRMAFSRSLEKSLDGVKNIEVTQTKKRSSSNACLTIVEKTKNKSNTQGKSYPLWLGFKAMNALNASKSLAKESHRSVSELVKNGMYEDEALECQDCITAYPYVPQELWPNKYNLEEQNFHFTQIPSEIEVFEGFAMDYHVALFFELEEMVVPKKKALEKITKRLESMKISLGEDISDPIAIMCTHGGKQWSGHAKIHLKNIQKNGITLLQGTRPFIIRLPDNKLHRAKVCKSYDTIASNEMLSINITSDIIKDETWYNVFDEVVTEGFKRGHNYEIIHVRK
jgi:hypothetical protein